MEIDPRLRHTDDRSSNKKNSNKTNPDPHHHRRLPYNQYPAFSGPAASAHAGSGSRNVSGAYPELSPESPDQLSGSTSSSSNTAYYGGSTASHPFYPGEASIVAPGATTAETADPSDPLADLKRPRACEACRQLKVRCEPHDDHPTGSCKRCAKAGRPCVITAPSRKRQKKTDSRVAELEKKIDALTASLHASTPDVGAASDNRSHQAQEHVAPRRWLGGGPPPPRLSSAAGTPSVGGAKRSMSGGMKAPSRYNDGVFVPFSARPDSPPGSTRGIAASSVSTPADPILRSGGSNEFADVIDRGIVDVENAAKAFDRYVNNFIPVMPIVVFPPETTMGSVRRNSPVLFLVILSLSIGAFQPGVQMQLLHEVHRVFADRVVIKGEKSLELVQAIILSCMWYAPPDHFEELKFFQFIHMAIAIALDIGIGRRTSKKGIKHIGALKEILGKRGSPLDPDSLETRRAWMGCYFLAVNASMALRRPLLLRWHPYMDECIDILQSSPDALPSDQVLVYWAKLSHIAEEAGFQFSMDDPASSLSLHDPKVQYALRGFEKQLDQWREEVAPEYYTPILKHAEHIVNLYMHEISMHADHNVDDFRAPFWGAFREEPQVDRATAAHVDGLTTCLASIHAALDVMMSLDHDTIVCLPTIYFARTAYAFVALLKLFAAVTQSNSSLGKVFSPADLKVEECLNEIVEHLKISGTKPGGRTARRFCMILSMLRSWFVSRKENNDVEIMAMMPKDRESSSKPRTETTAGESGTDSRRLQVLTEVATGEPSMGRSIQQPSQSPNTATFSHPPVNVGVSTPATASGGGPISAETAGPWSQYPPSTAAAETPFYHQQQMPFTQQTSYDPNNTMMSNIMPEPQPAYAGFVPELGLQMSFDPEGLFALGNMLEDGFFTIPTDWNQNFYPPG